MAKVDYPAQQCDVDQLLKETSPTNLDFIIDGIHFGRGDAYYDQNTSTQLKHKTTKLKCWRIVNESLEEVEDKTINNFYSSETYIIQWESITDSLRFNTDDILSKHENKIYFYWKGESAAKGFSPLPESIEKDTPPVERIVQWAEPPAFLQLFSGTFIVHLENCNKLNNDPHLYIVRGEIENEIHLYEISLQKKNLRSRTSFVMYFPKEKSSIIWHGANSNSHCKDSIKTITGKIFGSDFTVISESSENEKFLKSFPKNENDYFHSASSKIIDYTPRLFYFNKITGSFSVTEIECSHKSAYLTPFPFLQSHLYTAEQPAIFLLDDNDEIWIWYGWQRDEDNDFKSECFITAINYAKQKSNIIKRLVKVHKVVAGFEPDNFTNLFPTWKKREDIAQIQEKDGVLPNTNALIEVISDENLAQI
ncbi:supervillin-like isoform X1 [Tenebrio molitor]|uniref:supervillin-like isoform X1 n=1 Tax=Tenebrio molitor TaxID=7067 RepID=UPI0036248AE1